MNGMFNDVGEKPNTEQISLPYSIKKWVKSSTLIDAIPMPDSFRTLLYGH